MTIENTQIRDNMVQSLGHLAESAGFNRTIGQIYGMLYLSPVRLSLGEIAECLAISKGNISLNMRTMERLGLVRRYNRPADRRDYYEADVDFWKVIRGILRDREKKLINDIKKMLTESIKEVGKSAGSSADEETKFYRARLKHMLDFLNTFNRLFTAYLALEKFRFGGLTVPDMKRNHSENSV